MQWYLEKNGSTFFLKLDGILGFANYMWPIFSTYLSLQMKMDKDSIDADKCHYVPRTPFSEK